MPTYEYACTSCGHHLEVVQSFHDEPLTTCPVCEAPLRKVFGSIGIVLKGSGFYKNDSRSSTGRSAGSAGGDGSPKTDGASSGDSSSTPAAASSNGDSKESAKPSADRSSSASTSGSGSGSSPAAGSASAAS